MRARLRHVAKDHDIGGPQGVVRSTLRYSPERAKARRTIVLLAITWPSAVAVKTHGCPSRATGVVGRSPVADQMNFIGSAMATRPWSSAVNFPPVPRKTGPSKRQPAENFAPFSRTRAAPATEFAASCMALFRANSFNSDRHT